MNFLPAESIKLLFRPFQEFLQTQFHTNCRLKYKHLPRQIVAPLHWSEEIQNKPLFLVLQEVHYSNSEVKQLIFSLLMPRFP